MHLLSTIRTTSAMFVVVCAVSATFPAKISAQQGDVDAGNDAAKQAPQNDENVKSIRLPSEAVRAAQQQSTERAAEGSSTKALQKFTEVELQARNQIYSDFIHVVPNGLREEFKRRADRPSDSENPAESGLSNQTLNNLLKGVKVLEENNLLSAVQKNTLLSNIDLEESAAIASFSAAAKLNGYKGKPVSDSAIRLKLQREVNNLMRAHYDDRLQQIITRATEAGLLKSADDFTHTVVRSGKAISELDERAYGEYVEDLKSRAREAFPGDAGKLSELLGAVYSLQGNLGYPKLINPEQAAVFIGNLDLAVSLDRLEKVKWNIENKGTLIASERVKDFLRELDRH